MHRNVSFICVNYIVTLCVTLWNTYAMLFDVFATYFVLNHLFLQRAQMGKF